MCDKNNYNSIDLFNRRIAALVQEAGRRCELAGVPFVMMFQVARSGGATDWRSINGASGREVSGTLATLFALCEGDEEKGVNDDKAIRAL